MYGNGNQQVPQVLTHNSHIFKKLKFLNFFHRQHLDRHLHEWSNTV